MKKQNFPLFTFIGVSQWLIISWEWPRMTITIATYFKLCFHNYSCLCIDKICQSFYFYLKNVIQKCLCSYLDQLQMEGCTSTSLKWHLILLRSLCTGFAYKKCLKSDELLKRTPEANWTSTLTSAKMLSLISHRVLPIEITCEMHHLFLDEWWNSLTFTKWQNSQWFKSFSTIPYIHVVIIIFTHRCIHTHSHRRVRCSEDNLNMA